MLKVGLTGGIGCGKSTAVGYFRECGIPVIEADVIAREVVEPGKPALQEIHALFGGQAVGVDGTLNRAWLRQAVFNDPERLQQLESILQPRIQAAILAGIDACPGNVPYVVVDVPLLLEKGYKGIFDRIVVVDCLPEQQLMRVRQRDGCDEALIGSIMRAQLSSAERLEHADDVLENKADKLELFKQLAVLHDKYQKPI